MIPEYAYTYVQWQGSAVIWFNYGSTQIYSISVWRFFFAQFAFNSPEVKHGGCRLEVQLQYFELWCKLLGCSCRVLSLFFQVASRKP